MLYNYDFESQSEGQNERRDVGSAYDTRRDKHDNIKVKHNYRTTEERHM